MLLEIRHETDYRYAAAANYSIQYVRLTPRSDAGQRVATWRIDSPGRRWRQVDSCGNVVYVVSVVEPHSGIRVVAQGRVETSDERGQWLPHDSAVPPLAFALQTPMTAPDAAIRALAGDAFGACLPGKAGRAEFERLMEAIGGRIVHAAGSTGVHASAAESMAAGAGVCRDMTHVFLAACRAWGIPARYVSGYALDSSSHSAPHSWAEAWVAEAQRGAGAWLGFDVAHNRVCGPELCRVAVGRDYMEAGPIRGSRMGGVDEEMTVAVSVAAVAG